MKEKTIWSSTSKINSHLTFGPHIEKNITILNNILKDANVDTRNIKNVLDWGPGGGWLSKNIGGEKLTLFDIVDKHEKIQKKNCKNSFKDITFYNVSGENYPDLEKDIDLAILFSVVYHMPSIPYVTRAMKKLNDYAPKYIAFRNVFTKKEVNWQAKSFDHENILRMSLFGKNNFLQFFPNYSIVSSNIKTDAPSVNGPQCYSQSFLLKLEY